MRQILVAKCSLRGKDLLPYLLNPVTQKPFSTEELNNFTSFFNQSINLWKQNLNINNSIIRKNVRKLTTNYAVVGPVLTIFAGWLFPGGQFAALLAVMSSIIWSIGYAENIENVWELENIAGNFKHYDKKYAKAASKVVLASVEAILFSFINNSLSLENFTRYKAMGNFKINGPLLENQMKNTISADKLQFLNSINLFSFGIPVLKKGITGEVLYNIVKNVPLSGYSSMIYKADKLEKIQKGILTPDSLDGFDKKLNKIIIKEQEMRSESLHLDAGFLDDSTKSPLKTDFCNVLGKTVDVFKKGVELRKLIEHFKKIERNYLLYREPQEM